MPFYDSGSLLENKRHSERSWFLKFFFVENSRISEAITVPASHVGKLRDVTPPGPNRSWFHSLRNGRSGIPRTQEVPRFELKGQSHGDGGDEICKRDGKIYSMCFCFSMVVAI